MFFFNNYKKELDQQKKGRDGCSSLSLLVTRESSILAIETKFHLGEDSGQGFTQIRISQENHDETETTRLSRKVRCVISNEPLHSLAKDSVKSSFTQSVCLGQWLGNLIQGG